MTTTTSVGSEIVRNRAAADALAVVESLVLAENEAGFYPAPSFPVYEAAVRNLHDTATKAALVAEVGQTITTADGPLIVAGRVRGGDRLDVVLTTDGVTYKSTWHHGPEGKTVRYEAWALRTTTGEVINRFHGYADANTRQIVQTG